MPTPADDDALAEALARNILARAGRRNGLRRLLPPRRSRARRRRRSKLSCAARRLFPRRELSLRGLLRKRHWSRSMEDYAPPFSRTVAVDSVGEAGVNVRFSATPEECAENRRTRRTRRLRDLTVEAQLTRRGREGLLAQGAGHCRGHPDLRGHAGPVRDRRSTNPSRSPSRRRPRREAAYERAMAELEAAHATRRALLAEQPDPPDPIIDGRIDLGALACEFLALGPRSASAQARRRLRGPRRGRRASAVAVRRSCRN